MTQQEDGATRVRVGEAQWGVYVTNSTALRGKGNVYSFSFMITHLMHWMPAFVKYGVNVDAEFAAIGGGTPSTDTDKKIAPRAALAFLRYGKAYCAKLGRPGLYADVRTRIKTHVWAQFCEDARKEGFDPGTLEYED